MALIGALLAVGAGAHSLGVLAAAVDYAADAAAIGVSLLAISLGQRPPSPGRPRGYPKATGYAALVNGGWLLALSVGVGIGAVHRLLTGAPAVHGRPVLIVSVLAAAVMVVGALVLRGGADESGEDLNMTAVLLDTVAAAAAAAGVAVTGGIILATGRLYWLDPAVALLIAAVVCLSAGALVRRVLIALLQPPEP